MWVVYLCTVEVTLSCVVVVGGNLTRVVACRRRIFTAGTPKNVPRERL